MSEPEPPARRKRDSGTADARRSPSRVKVEHSATRFPPLPLLLPATADHGALATAIAGATGAKASDARVLARVVAVLRGCGGQASLASLTQNPKRLKRILARYPRLIDVQLGIASIDIRWFQAKAVAACVCGDCHRLSLPT